MIRLHGRDYGTARELARHLGADVTERMIRHWREEAGLATVRLPGPGHGILVSPLDQAELIEQAKRQSGRGRPRRVRAA